MSERNGGQENQNSRRLDQMQDVIQSMITLVHEQSKAWSQAHQEVMAEIRELITLQKEHRIDIMALFQANKEFREDLKKSSGGDHPE
jgi:replicative DNA helicase